MKTNLLILLTFFTFTFGFSQNNYWIESNFKELNLKGTQYIFPNKYKSFKLNYSACKNYLFNAPMIDYNGNVKTSSFIITLPLPDGSFENFSVVESPVYEPEFAQKFPEIKTFLAYCANHPEWYTRLDITPHGFHAMILGTKNGTVLIDPITHNGGEVNDYFVYYKNDSQNKGDFECLLDEDTASNFQQKMGGNTAARFGTCELRTYRLAVACTGEYAQFHGGTVPLTAAAQVTTMNRVNGVYERDMAIHMNIIGNNNLLIYLNGATDPYTNNSGATMLNENQTNIDNVIGSSNYDIGHVFSTGGGGIAQLRSPCGTGKARGVTGQGAPIGDYFDIDYVAHEMGHQFGGNHTQNNNCNRNNATAVEPGSASTIMGYAGICAPDVQAHSDDYFHGINLEEIGNFITGTGNSCAVRTALSNNEPSVSYPATTITLPVSTPFALTATGSDPDNDTLTYCWEQMDNQTATMPPVSTATGGPNFRSFNPTTSPTRYFPNLPDVIAGNSPTWEVLPTVSRSMDFRVVVRDNATGGGCNDHTDISVNFVGSAGPFVVTYPTASGITWDGNTTETVTWNVANTGSGTTVNCGNVNILISYDGGVTFNDTLLANTPNDGSQIITVPNQATTTAIVMVQCAESNGTFFDVSNNVFTITAITNDFTVVANPTSLSVCSGSDAQYTIDVDKIGTFNSNVVLSLSGLPAGLSSSFSTNNQNPAYSIYTYYWKYDRCSKRHL
ncbi:MAG: M12 family metallo-peptidase [Chitinophagales bacterium]